MPAGLIHPKINHHSITKKDRLEHRQESIGIAFCLTHHPMSARNGIDPSKDIQPFMMLALRQNQRLLSFLHPNPPQLRMKTKPCFIRKKEDSFPLTSLGRQEFFLRSSETPPPLPLWLEHNGKSVVSKKTLIDESSAGLDALSIELHEPVPGTLRPPPHPIDYASNPISWDSSLSRSPKPAESVHQDDRDVPAVSLTRVPQSPSRSPLGSISRRSSGLGQRGWQPRMISSLLKGEAGQRYVSQPRLRVSSLPILIGPHVLRLHLLLLMLSSVSLPKKVSCVFRKVLYTKLKIMSTYL